MPMRYKWPPRPERTGDRALNSQAAAKADEAAEVLQSIHPDPKLAAELEERKVGPRVKRGAQRRKQEDRRHRTSSTLARWRTTARSASAKTQNDALIEQQLLPPWLAEREALAKVQVVPAQEGLLKKFLEYMSLRAEGWRLTAKGLRSGDRRLLEQGNAQPESRERVDGAVNKTLEPRPRRPEILGGRAIWRRGVAQRDACRRAAPPAPGAQGRLDRLHQHPLRSAPGADRPQRPARIR